MGILNWSRLLSSYCHDIGNGIRFKPSGGLPTFRARTELREITLSNAFWRVYSLRAIRVTVMIASG